MGLNPNISLFLIGLAIGLMAAIIGGLIDYYLNLRHKMPERTTSLPGCLFYMAGGLGVTGLVAMAASLLLNGGIMEALVLGAGVLTGFYFGFILLFGLWLLLNRD